ncbi:MAG TPA: hypothetical protein VGE52_03795, partial [Pirellulales bacterium]
MKSLRVALGGLMIVAACSGCAAMLEGSLDRLERRLTFFPRKLSKEKPVPQGVKSVWFDVTDVAAAGQSASEPGSVTPSAAPAETRVWRLHGVIAEAPDPTRRRAVLMYCHGNRGCVDDCVGRMRDTANRFNVTAFTFDYRGFGRSEGIPN